MKVLMVCLGNICRSPLAEGILRNKVEAAGLAWEIDSCGTAGFHVGNPPDPRSIEVAYKYGIYISNIACRQFHENDFQEFDLILSMDFSNQKDIKGLGKNRDELGKVRMIMDFAFPGKGVSVPDPYYGGAEGFETVYSMLDTACDAIIQKYR
ncbi:MAG: protein-tyrosine phosphatase [Sphingobacteriales bacterium]|jgi:protein-tyrosine phosphatase